MAAWFEFALYSLQKLVETVFSLDVGLGFSLGDLDVALLLIGVIATALVVRIGSFASSEVDAAHRVYNREVRNQIERSKSYNVTVYNNGRRMY